MIPFCIRVLKGDEPASNERKITKSVALILLVHYLGDIHQPLHVGAEYFDAQGNAFEPTSSNPGFGDQGGGKLTLFTLINGTPRSAGKFHGYWDGQTVQNAFGTTADLKIAKRLANREPDNWQLSGPVNSWAEQLANEILPLAHEAHSRLEFSTNQDCPRLSTGQRRYQERSRIRDEKGARAVLCRLGRGDREEGNSQGWLAFGGAA
jgi:hypothetical protein